MSLTLFYITNNPQIVLIAEKYGVDRIWIDLETLGKEERQKNVSSVKSHHTISDITRIKPLLTTSELMVRVDPWNEYSAAQIDAVIDAGADWVMLPMWKTVDEIRSFLHAVHGRAKTTLLLETREAVGIIDEVLKLDFDEIHIGLNDLHISYGMSFMFELLADGTVDTLCAKFRQKGIPYGFGGIARLGQGMLNAEKVIMEHYRLGSTRAILSRSFCNVNQFTGNDLSGVEQVFGENMMALRAYERYCAAASEAEKERNRDEAAACVRRIAERIREKNGYEA